MRFACSLVFLVAVSAAPASRQSPGLQPDSPITCSDCEDWNQPLEPFRVFGNTYYVGVAGVSAVLIASDNGLILVDGALPQSAPLIDANIRSLGFRTEDIRLIVISHEHYDHVGGVAALQRASGATVATSEAAARALAAGVPTPDDPQYESSKKLPFPAVRNVKVVGDGEVLLVGPLAITGHLTPGHTPGAMSWSWQSCEPFDSRPLAQGKPNDPQPPAQGRRCLNMVYADSLNPVSDDGFRFTARPKSVDAFRAAIDKFDKLPCDVLLASHPFSVDMGAKLARWKADPSTNPFIDSGACRAYAATARQRLDARLAEEAK